MAIIKPRPGAPVKPVPTPVIAKPDYKAIAVDNRYQPKETLLSFIEGAPWTVESYYMQVLGADSALAGQGLSTDATVQGYKVIHGMEIRVTSALSNPTQDTKTKELGSKGAATLYPPLIPNVGDMFTADLLDGRLGVFQVTDSTRLAIFRDTCHSIEYELVDFGATAARLADLKRKILQVTYFEKDFVFHGQNPILVSDDYENLQYLRRSYGILIAQYFKRFSSKEYGTLILPEQADICYDGFLVTALKQHLSTNDARELINLRQLNADDDQAMSADSIWTVLLARDRVLLQDAFWQVGSVASSRFTRNPVFDGIRYSGVKKVIYPVDPMVRVDNQYGEELKVPEDFVPMRKAVVHRKLASLINASAEDETMIGIKNTFIDGYYVFSKEFYENNRTVENAQSLLELCVQDYLDGNEIPYSKVRTLVEASSRWDNVNSFYYIPILIILIKAVIRAI